MSFVIPNSLSISSGMFTCNLTTMLSGIKNVTMKHPGFTPSSINAKSRSLCSRAYLNLNSSRSCKVMSLTFAISFLNSATTLLNPCGCSMCCGFTSQNSFSGVRTRNSLRFHSYDSILFLILSRAITISTR